jgi:integrative and conjugative element protein (TIGR02256 family)
MTFVRKGGGSVYFAASAVDKLMDSRQLQASSAETGGVMLGRLIVGTADIVVDEVIGPLAEDRRSRFTFFRPKKQTQQIVDQAWYSSCGTKIYLGDWHTHPEDIPNPSAQDLRNWKQICEAAVFEQESLLFLIAGRVSVRIWELPKGGSPKDITWVESIGQPTGALIDESGFTMS